MHDAALWLRPRGRRSTEAPRRCAARAYKMGYITIKPTGITFVNVPTAVGDEVRALAAATGLTRQIELRAGAHRRNGADLRLHAIQNGTLTEDEAADYQKVMHARNAARQNKWLKTEKVPSEQTVQTSIDGCSKAWKAEAP